MPEAPHFTLVLDVKKSTTAPVVYKNTYERERNIDPKGGDREVTSVAHLVLRAPTLEALILKATAHINLIEE